MEKEQRRKNLLNRPPARLGRLTGRPVNREVRHTARSGPSPGPAMGQRRTASRPVVPVPRPGDELRRQELRRRRLWRGARRGYGERGRETRFYGTGSSPSSRRSDVEAGGCSDGGVFAHGGARATAAMSRMARSILGVSVRFLWRRRSWRRGGAAGLLRFARGSFNQR